MWQITCPAIEIGRGYPDEIAAGIWYRKPLSFHPLFLLKRPHRRRVLSWMKNTLICRGRL